MNLTFIFLLFSFCFFVSVGSLLTSNRRTNGNGNTLQQVHIIFRHGDRAPISPYPNSLNLKYVWPFGLGQLTNVGKRQQFELGRFLRKRYNKFLSTDPREIEVRSSDKDRCLASAEVNLAAFFKPRGKWVWNNDLKWQPVPIHTRPGPEDWVLNEDAECPAADEEAAKFPRSREGIAYTRKYRDLMGELTVMSGKPVTDPSSVQSVQGVSLVEKINRLPVGEWVNRLWPQMVEAANEGFVVKYASKKIQRLRGGPLLNHVTELMKKSATASNPENPKAFMYSTHDAIVTALMSAMGVFNRQAVPYCGTVLVELHKFPRYADHTVRLFYRNGTGTDPFALQIPGCSQDCPLRQFIDLLEDVTPQDIKRECHF